MSFAHRKIEESHSGPLVDVNFQAESFMIHQDVHQKEAPHQAAVIKLIGVGGGGCNAVEQMIAADIHGVEFTCVNTDAQALAKYHPDHVIQLGNHLTRGLGAGTDPEIGRLAAEEDRELLASAIEGTDMLFLTAGMGGGTGTGAISVIARTARELGILTVAVVTKPFSFEGGKRRRVAEVGIAELREHVDSLIVVPNENLLTHLGPNISLIDAFSASNDVLTNAVQSIAELITNPGLINVDFADVKSVMTEMGEAMMSTGRGIGDYRARDAAIAATESPLLDEIDLKEARGILANITASADLSMGEFQIVGDILDQITADDANVVIGTVFDQRMTDEIRVTVVATGLNSSRAMSRPRSLPLQRAKPEKKKKKTSRLLSFGASLKEKSETRKEPLSRSPEPQHRQPAATEHYRAAPQRDEYYHDYDDVAPAAEYKPRATQHTFHDDRIGLPDEIIPEPTNDAVVDKEICNACGNTQDAHSPNCPRAENNPVAVPSAQIESTRESPQHAKLDNDNFDMEQIMDEIRKQPATKQSSKPGIFSTGKKKPGFNKHMAGLVAGTVALITIFYVVITNKIAVNNNDFVENRSQGSTIAERKLKAANRRLTGIDQ